MVGINIRVMFWLVMLLFCFGSCLGENWILILYRLLCCCGIV